MPNRKRPYQLGLQGRKLQPKLRMISNSSPEVNAVRAEQCASVAVTSRQLVEQIPIQRGDECAPVEKKALGAKAKPAYLKKIASNVYVNVFIETLDAGVRKRRFPGEKARKRNLVSARVPLSKLKNIAIDDDVTYIEIGESLATPTPVISSNKVVAPPLTLRKFGSTSQHQDGEGVLIGIIDVQGFDFSHPDFLDGKGKTRFVRIWDQGAEEGTARPSPKNSPQFDYGSELFQEHLNAAIAASSKLNLPPYELERQSQMEPGSHGTHVASIAAGNRGVCRKAMIAGVLISLPKDDTDRRRSFYDSTRIADAVDYLINVADELSKERKKPVPLSINVSLGTNGHAHDASSAISRWIDAAMSTPGRCISVAAGNAGQEAAAFEGDSGYVMGRIHTSGTVPARDLTKDIEWLVVGNGIADLSENELELWYSPQDRFEVSVRPPLPGADFIGPIRPREFIENRQLKDGSFLSVYNELYHPANGANYISIYLSPFLSEDGVVGVAAGRWTIRLRGQEVRDGRYHGWIERDDPRRLGRVGDREAWRFPSFFSETSNVDNSSVSSLACGHHVIAVANLDDTAERVNVTSSQGPTRDERNKPDTAAPGTNIVAAKGFAGKNDLWVSMTGTSMASPFVTGVAGLMLAAEPKLTAAQIEGIIIRTARPLPGASFKWLNDVGFGRINPEACIAEAGMINKREDRT